MIRRLNIFCFVVLLAVVCTADDYDYELEVSETRTWPAGGISQIEAITKNGNISVSATQDTIITAEITKSCKGLDQADAEAYIDNVVVEDNVTGGKLTLEAEMPNNGRSYGADFDISTPESIYLDLTTTNGNVSLTDMIAGAKLRTTNGNITVQNLRGGIDGQTTNGSINCDLAVLGATESAVLSTTNGNATLRLPSDVSATFDASTTNGEVAVIGFASVNYSINEPTHKAGTIGSGPGGTISISSTNGNVTIRVH